MLVGLIVAIFFILLALSVAAPKVAQELRREREVEAVHRGNQYVRAIRLYTKRGQGPFPGSMDQLEKSNNIRYLRQRYIDPMTGKEDWRLIKVGEAKTTVKGFFGQPLAGLTPGLGANAGSASQGMGGTGAGGAGQTSSAFGSSSPGSSAFGSSSPGGGFGSSSPGGLGASGAAGSTGMPTLGGGSSPGGATNGSGTLGAPDSSGSSGAAGSMNNTPGATSGFTTTSAMSGGAPFVGVGVPKEGDSITVLNEQTTYNTWEFIYDPRIEQLYAKGAMMGGGASGLGANAGSSSGFGGNSPTPGSGSSGFGATPGSGSSGFGATPGSGFGATPGSGFGSSPGSSSPTAPTTPPQQPQE
jgi:type II secretory pathway pseudopilin PulG